MKLYETLENHLKNEPNYVTDDGELKKWVVLNKAQNSDPELISLLLKNEILKEEFFLDVEGTLVFNQNQFSQFLEQKNYLNDSYTQYKINVGLTINDKYLKQRNDVALVWPFKDCVLEGGQSREEDKREEIFFNETLAQDEITQLRDPKVLTNAKRYDKKGEHNFTGFSRDAELNKKRGLPEDTITDNLILKGNNLLALHSLKKEFAEKVKLIYIDPPYYFVKKSKTIDTFTYNSNFKLSTWLVFMRNRLIQAKKILHDKGIIFVSIDDGGQAYLKILMDEIFGTENFVANLPTVMNLKGNNDEFGFAGTHEYTLVYAKDKSVAEVNEFPIEENKIMKNWEKDEIGYFKKGAPLRATGTEDKREDRAEMFYPILVKGENAYSITDEEHERLFDNEKRVFNDNFLEKLIKSYKKKGYEIVLPITGDNFGRWRWGFSKKNKKRLETDVIINRTNNGITLYKKQRPQLGELPSKKPKSIFYKPEYSSGNGTAQIKRIFGERVFSNPKPLELIKDIVSLGSSENDIVLDFHAGSGTTAHAVLDLMKDDDCKRQFILVEQMDYIKTVTKKRVESVINNNKLGRVTYFELKKYNQSFIKKIKKAKDFDALLSIWGQMKEKSFLNYNVDIKKQDEHIDEFRALSLSEQKQHLCEILDKNQLYVNLSSLNDNDFVCSDEEKELTRDFYQIKK